MKLFFLYSTLDGIISRIFFIISLFLSLFHMSGNYDGENLIINTIKIYDGLMS